MSENNIRGSLSQLALPDVLEFLKISGKTGVLSVRREDVEKFLFVEAGNVVFAGSNLPEDRLGNVLLRTGKINQAQFDISVKRLGESGGKRQGRLLVEIGALGPQELWAVVRGQICDIVYSLFDWEEGEFRFEEKDLPSDESVTVDVSITELIAEGIRRVENRCVIEDWAPAPKTVFELVVSAKSPVTFADHEKHVMKLIDGRTSLETVCEKSEIGHFETLKVLYMLSSISYLGVVTGAVEVPEGSGKDSSLLEAYNKAFSAHYRYLLQELGPLAMHLFDKYWAEIRENETFALGENVFVTPGGGLAELPMMECLSRDPEASGKLEPMLQALYERQIRGITKILGEDHARHLAHTLHPMTRGSAGALAP